MAKRDEQKLYTLKRLLRFRIDVWEELEVEAASEQEAIAIAHDTPPGDFDEMEEENVEVDDREDYEIVKVEDRPEWWNTTETESSNESTSPN